MRRKDRTHVTWNIAEHLKSAVGIFEKETGLTLTPASTAYASDVPKEQFLSNVEKRGKWAKKAASYLMEVLYAARMCCPNLIVLVQSSHPGYKVVS